MRFSELSRQLAGASQKMLTQTLRSLEVDGLVTRTVTPTGRNTTARQPNTELFQADGRLSSPPLPPGRTIIRHHVDLVPMMAVDSAGAVLRSDASFSEPPAYESRSTP